MSESCVLLVLSGPMQAWGETGRFDDRPTAALPTRSGVLGMVASALGRDRRDSTDDLAQLQFGVLSLRSGQVRTDYHTVAGSAHKDDEPSNAAWPYTIEDKSRNVTRRGFLHDAVFLVALRGPVELARLVAAAMRSPVRPLFLGRRSCPLSVPPFLALVADAELQLEERAQQAAGETWQSSVMAAHLLAGAARLERTEMGGLQPGLIELEVESIPATLVPPYAQRVTRRDLPVGRIDWRRYATRDVWQWSLDPAEVQLRAPRLLKVRSSGRPRPTAQPAPAPEDLGPQNPSPGLSGASLSGLGEPAVVFDLDLPPEAALEIYDF